MKIYSDVLTRTDLETTVKQVNGMYLYDIKPITKCKVRALGYNVVTASTIRNRYKNSGKYGASRLMAASQDDHGQWFARLYEIDPNARIAHYRHAFDFHASTRNKYNVNATV